MREFLKKRLWLAAEFYFALVMGACLSSIFFGWQNVFSTDGLVGILWQIFITIGAIVLGVPFALMLNDESRDAEQIAEAKRREVEKADLVKLLLINLSTNLEVLNKMNTRFEPRRLDTSFLDGCNELLTNLFGASLIRVMLNVAHYELQNFNFRMDVFFSHGSVGSRPPTLSQDIENCKNALNEALELIKLFELNRVQSSS
jgi:hypothetical protein